VTAARGNWSIGRALTLITSTFTLGTVIGPFTGGWIGDHFGRSSVYLVAGVLFIFSTLFVLPIAPQPRETHDPAAPPPSLLGNRQFMGLLALGFFVTLAMFLPQQFTPNFLQDVRGLSLGQIGWLGTIGGIGTTVQIFLSGFLDVRFGYILGQVGMGISSTLIWQMKEFGWIALAYFMLGGYRAARSLYVAQIRPMVLESQMGLAYGMSETVQGLSVIAAPVLAGFLYQHNPISMYPISVGGTILAIVLSLFFAPHTNKSQTAAPIELLEEIR
jgi:predicted MFS family arabinose efflux permease